MISLDQEFTPHSFSNMLPVSIVKSKGELQNEKNSLLFCNHQLMQATFPLLPHFQE